MKSWPWKRILAGFACLMILAGVAPIAFVYWEGFAHDYRPLTMALPLQQGEFSSPYFKTDANEDYQIDLGWRYSKNGPMALNFAWKVVDDRGALLQQGTCCVDMSGNSVTLGHYRPKVGLRQRLTLTNFRNSEGMDGAEPTLEIGVPEKGLESAYGSAAGLIFAAAVAGPGVLILLILLIWRAARSRSLAAGALP